LTFNGVDDDVSACMYYKAIEAITENVNCNRVIKDERGFFKSGRSEYRIFGKTFNAWKEENGLRRCTNPSGRLEVCFDVTDDVTAVYFNAVDLRLAREMHGKTSMVDGEKRTAYYVCNYETLPEARSALENGNSSSGSPFGIGADACVAFDFSESRPFTKFYVFKTVLVGVDGIVHEDPRRNLFKVQHLAASANLDGKEKFVPGLCKACHGGNNRQKFPGENDNAANGNIGAHFLPFDLDNFDYLEEVGMFSRRAQEGKFKRLNQMIVNDTDPAPAVRELIDGWYRDARTEQNSQFIPSGWSENEQLYRRVVKPSCRTCHVAMQGGFNFATLASFTALARAPSTDDPPQPNRTVLLDRVCNNPSPPEEARLFRSMPNSKVTFDLFWLDRVQRTVLQRFLRNAVVLPDPPGLQCPPP
jgi:hypothetical protein